MEPYRGGGALKASAPLEIPTINPAARSASEPNPRRLGLPMPARVGAVSRIRPVRCPALLTRDTAPSALTEGIPRGITRGADGVERARADELIGAAALPWHEGCGDVRGERQVGGPRGGAAPAGILRGEGAGTRGDGVVTVHRWLAGEGPRQLDKRGGRVHPGASAVAMYGIRPFSVRPGARGGAGGRSTAASLRRSRYERMYSARARFGIGG